MIMFTVLWFKFVFGFKFSQISLIFIIIIWNLFYHILSVYESFKEYIAVETLDGDNKYDAGEYGLQVSITWG